MSSSKNLPAVVLVGRSNVGKSTLFNKIAEENRSLVAPTPGTTRDILETVVKWRNKKFLLFDTGGLDPSKKDLFREPIIKQALIAQKKAALVVLTVDTGVGRMPEDKKIARDLRSLNKPILVAANKADTKEARARAEVFKPFGFPVYPVSAANGSGTGDLLDAITERLLKKEHPRAEPDVKLALIGKPNVGKSSLVNSLFGEERMIVSPLPHTTRDSQDLLVEFENKNFLITDTAGIRRHSQAGDDIEELSVAKAKTAIERCDVAAMVVDISKPLTSQDKRLGREIEDSGRGLFIVANKWDLIPDKDTATIEKYKDYLAKSLPGLSWAPIVFTSAEAGLRTRDMLKLAVEIKANMEREVTTNALSVFLKKLVKIRKPTIGRGTRRPRLLSLEQTGKNPPFFVLSVPIKTSLAKSYQQFILNELRDKFEYEGTPLKMTIREREPKVGEGADSIPEKKRLKHKRWVAGMRK